MSLYPVVESGLHESQTDHAVSRSTACSEVCINELMPNAEGSDQGIFPNGEWVELYNSGAAGMNLQNWTLEDIGGWVHPIDSATWVGFSELEESYVIPAGSYAVIAENEIGTLRLNNGGETLYLKDANGETVHTVTTGEATDGVSKISSENSSADWVDSEESTPGVENSEGGDGGGGNENPTVEPSEWNGKYDVKFTRIMPAEVPDRDNDWFELTNTGDEPVSLAGWTIERIRSTTPWISTFNDIEIDAGQTLVLTENPANLLADGGINALDGNIVLNNMPWLVDSGSALQLKSPNGTVVDAIAFGGGIAEIDGWLGAAVSVPGDGTPGLILMRGTGCGDYPDTDTGADWEQRWIRIGASTFCDGGYFTTEVDSLVSASIGPDSGFNDLKQWIDAAEDSIHLHIYQFMSPDLTHALLDAIEEGVEVTILLEEGILDGSSTINKQRGHAQTLHDAGATVLWMEDPTQISSPYAYIHSKIAVRDSESVWISSGNWKDSSVPPDGIGNREWSVILNSQVAAELVLSRMAWDENSQHLHISPHSSWHAPTFDWTMDSP